MSDKTGQNPGIEDSAIQDALDEGAPGAQDDLDAMESEMAADRADSISSKGKITPIRVAIAVAAVAAIWSVHGFVKAKILGPDVAFETAEGIESIDAAIAAAGLHGVVVPLTKGDGKIDILYAGAPECIHCQDFVSGAFEHYPSDTTFPPMDLDTLVEKAEREGLDLAYMPLAQTNIGVVLAAGEQCLGETSSLSAPARVKASYAHEKVVRAQGEEAMKMMKEAAPREEVEAIFRTALADLAEALSPGEDLDMDCYSKIVRSYPETLKAFGETFGRYGTPNFFFENETGEVSVFSGAGGLAPMLRQVAD